MAKDKRSFNLPERFAVWKHHNKACCWCGEPLDIKNTTIDHFIPESLLRDDAKRAQVLEEYGLELDFNINGFENWLPCHSSCNAEKSNRTFPFVLKHLAILQRPIHEAPKAKRTAERFARRQKNGNLHASVLHALEEGRLSPEDLEELLEDFRGSDSPSARPNMIQLESGLWIDKNDIIYEGICQCERNSCVGHERKINCIFSRYLHEWVVSKRLYWRCYDELIDCYRCHETDKRGHIGKPGNCGRPYQNAMSNE